MDTCCNISKLLCRFGFIFKFVYDCVVVGKLHCQKSMKTKSILVTEDNWELLTNSISRKVGIKDVITEAKSDQKVDKVKKVNVNFYLFQTKRHVNMVM